MIVRALHGLSIALFCLLIPSAILGAGPAHRDLPRIAVLPFAASPGLEVLGRGLRREVVKSLKDQVDVVSFDPAVLTAPPEECMMDVTCVDRLLAAGKADGLLVVQIEQDAESGSREPRVLVSLTAPHWPVSYAERWASPEASSVDRAVRVLIATARGLAQPGRAAERSADGGASGEVDPEEEDDDALREEPVAGRGGKGTKGAGTSGKDGGPSATEADGGDAGEEDGGAVAQAGEERGGLAVKEGKGGVEGGKGGVEGGKGGVEGAEKLAQSGLEPDDAQRRMARAREKREREAEEAREAAGRRAKSGSRWPDRSPAGPWHGWTLELMGGGAYGALGLSGESQLATSDTTVIDRYRWMLRTDTLGPAAELGAGLALGSHLEAGFSAGIITGSRELSLYYLAEDSSPFIEQRSGVEMHTFVTPRLRWIARTGGPVEPYAGLGLSIWLIPGFTDIETRGIAHKDLGPYQRFGIEPAFGVRFLLARRVFVGLEARALIDPGEPFLEKDIDSATGVIPVGDIVSPGSPSRVVGSVRLGVGLLL